MNAFQHVDLASVALVLGILAIVFTIIMILVAIFQ